MAGNNAFGERSDASLGLLDMFDDDESPSRTIDTGSFDTTTMVEDSNDESDEQSVDSNTEKERKIRKSMMYAVLGVGAMGLVGFGFKKVMEMFNRNRDQDDARGAGDMFSDAADTTTHLSDVSSMGATNMPTPSPSSEAIAQANINTSLQQSNTFVAGVSGNNPAAMTGAQ